MANIQIDEGNFTRIHNALLEKLILIKLSGQELQLILFIFRKTFGFVGKHKGDYISLSQIGKALDVSPIRAHQILISVKELNIISVENKGKGSANFVTFNKDIDLWATKKNLSTKGNRSTKENLNGVLRKNDRTTKKNLSRSTKENLRHKRNYKETTTKDNEKDKELTLLISLWSSALSPARLFEQEFIQELLERLGFDTAKRLIREFRDNGFHKLKTMRDSLDWQTGNIIPKDKENNSNYIDSIIN